MNHKMHYALVPKNGSYRGIDRAMSTEDIFPGRKYSAKDLELYFDFVNDTDLSPTAPTLETLKKYKQQFEQYHANCEIILYGDHPLYPPESETYHFLGIDIVNDGESFLENPNWNPSRVRALLNSDGLCSTLDVAKKVQQILCAVDQCPLTLCWVYLYCPAQTSASTDS